TERGWYTYDRHVDLVARVLDTLDLQNATVVVQDWGGPIGLRWAVENADRVGRLAILNTGLFTGRVSKGFLRWRDFAERNPDLPIGFIVDGGTGFDLAPGVKEAYEAPFPTPESKAGAAAFPLLVPTSDEDAGAEVGEGDGERLDLHLRAELPEPARDLPAGHRVLDAVGPRPADRARGGERPGVDHERVPVRLEDHDARARLGHPPDLLQRPA